MYRISTKSFTPLFAVLLLLVSCAKEEAPLQEVLKPIPALTQEQTTMLADCQDGTRAFDEAGLYALLGASTKWPMDAWGGAHPLQIETKVDPVSKDKNKTLRVQSDPAKYRGEPLLIEGTVIQVGSGVPNNPNGLLSRPDPRWGNSLTYWVVRIGHTQYDPQAMVYFPTDGRSLPQVKVRDRVRIAARFYKVFTAEAYVGDPKNHGQLVPMGREESFCAFVAGPAEKRATGMSEISPMNKLMAIIVLLAMCFGGLWFIKSFTQNMRRDRAFKTPAQRWAERLERERDSEIEEDEDEEGIVDDQGLPTDPAEALRVLSSRDEDATAEGDKAQVKIP